MFVVSGRFQRKLLDRESLSFLPLRKILTLFTFFINSKEKMENEAKIEKNWYILQKNMEYLIIYYKITFKMTDFDHFCFCFSPLWMICVYCRILVLVSLHLGFYFTFILVLYLTKMRKWKTNRYPLGSQALLL